MKHIKIIKDERGKFEIEISLWIVDQLYKRDRDGNTFRYDVFVRFIRPNKRKAEFGNFLDMLTPEQILEAKMEFWEMIKPV